MAQTSDMEERKKSAFITLVIVLTTVVILTAIKAVDLTIDSKDVKAVTLTSTQAVTQPGVVNINTASREELETLKEISTIRSQAIIDYREKNGDFKTVDELTNVEGIDKGILELNRDFITV